LGKLGSCLSLDLTLIGDGAFLYNPVLGSLGAARDYKLPTLTVVFNNKKYAAMQGMHQKMYPDGIAAEIDLYHGLEANRSGKPAIIDVIVT
jgi:acetolactate synthase-1/2/3 large subunit